MSGVFPYITPALKQSVLAGAGADIDAKDALGMTPLHYAAKEGRTISLPSYCAIRPRFISRIKGQNLYFRRSSQIMWWILLAAGA
jgi:ankyrin repeat protein